MKFGKACIETFIRTVIPEGVPARYYIHVHTQHSSDIFLRYDAIVETPTMTYYILLSKYYERKKTLERHMQEADEFLNPNRQIWVVCWNKKGKEFIIWQIDGHSNPLEGYKVCQNNTKKLTQKELVKLHRQP